MLKVDPNEAPASELAAALVEIQPKLTPRQLAALEVLYRAEGNAIPDDGAGKYSEFVLTFGKVGGKISNILGKMPSSGYHLMWVAFQTQGQPVRQWQMRSNFVEAIGQLGWFESRSPDELPEGSGRSAKVPTVDTMYADDVPDDGTYLEGSVRLTRVNAYERSRDARLACIAHYGATCNVCDLDFKNRYGPIGADFIHVHHEVPISSIGVGYRVDPIRDLKPVCPNCHAMLHRQDPPLSLAQLRAMLRR